MNWHALESIPGLNAVPAIWHRRIGAQFDEFRNAFLQSRPETARFFPCQKCGCAHEITVQTPDDIVAVCACDPWNCPDLKLTLADIQILELNWAKLGRALCQAFSLEPRAAEIGLHHTCQIGSWSGTAVPVLLSIQHQRVDFQHVVVSVAMRLRRDFILLAPTSRNLDAISQGVLADAEAGFFPLDSHVLLGEQGTLAPRSAPAELFARFTPELKASPGAVDASRAGKTTTASLQSVPKGSTGVRYGLRKGLKVWKLIFEGKEAELKHEQGIFYVAWLLTNSPSQPIHALDLAAKIPALYRAELGITQIVAPSDGRRVPLPNDARLQERNLGIDDAQALRALLRKQQELEAILDSEEESEPVKAEALRELEAMTEFQRAHGRRSEDAGQRTVRAVRMAIKRFHQHLVKAKDATGNPHPVLRPFAAHLQKYLLIPSGRYSGPKGLDARAELAGCLTYQPPAGVIWHG